VFVRYVQVSAELAPLVTVRGVIEYGRDPAKEAENVRQHSVAFDDAIVALRDPFAVEWFDEGHSADEPRFIKVGRDIRGRFLTVVTSDGGHGPRIISARRASKRERNAYESQRPLGPA
jgi:uncharacterized DUF497 family protein